MRLQDLINSKYGVGIGLLLSRLFPSTLAYPLAYWIADRIASRTDTSLVKAIRANQWVISSGQLAPHEIDRRTRDTLRNTGRSIFDFYHYLHRPQKILDMVTFDSSFLYWFDIVRQKKQPVIFVSPHLSNFDLMMRAIILRGAQYQVLSYPDPNAGYRWQNELRQLPGLKITPMSIQALREASETLNSNGAVITGIDRPLVNSDAKYRPCFFGRPAALPVFHIRLALKHDLPLVILTGIRKPDGRSLVLASDAIPLQRHADLQQEIVRNAETVLAVMETYIRQAPEQWAMFYPVWPEALAHVHAN